MPPIKIVFLGLNDIGKNVLEYLESLDQDEIFLITTKEELQKVESIRPDLVLSVGFRHIIPKVILEVPPLGAINFHKAVLPLNRGANPAFWSVYEGTKAGVSIHYMDEGIDTGDLIAQREVMYDFSDTAETLYQRLEQTQIELFQEVWPQIREGRTNRTPQQGPSSYHEIKDFKSLRRIDPESKVKVSNFLNLLKAMTFPPFNNAYIEMDGEKYFIEISIKKEGKTKEGLKRLLRQY